MRFEQRGTAEQHTRRECCPGSCAPDPAQDAATATRAGVIGIRIIAPDQIGIVTCVPIRRRIDWLRSRLSGEKDHSMKFRKVVQIVRRPCALPIGAVRAARHTSLRIIGDAQSRYEYIARALRHPFSRFWIVWSETEGSAAHA